MKKHRFLKLILAALFTCIGQVGFAAQAIKNIGPDTINVINFQFSCSLLYKLDTI